MSQPMESPWTELEKTLPPVIPRKNISLLTGGLITRGTMANLDSKGLGPSGKIRIGKSICYTKQSFMEWLQKRVQG